jgi:Tfp pilus assembly protein PilN
VSRSAATPLHIEWTPGYIRVMDPVSSEKADGATFADVSVILNGHKEAIVGVGHSAVFLKSVRLPKASPEDLRAILGVQLGQLFPLPADQLSFDFIQTSDVNAEGCLTVVGAIRSADILRIRADMKQVGLTPTRILPLALAAAPVASRAGFQDAVVAESDSGGLALDVVQDGIVRYSRIAPGEGDAEGEIRRTLSAAKAGTLPVVTAGSVEIPNSSPGLDSLLAVVNEAPPFDFELTEDRLRLAKKRIADRTRLGVLLVLSAILLIALIWADRNDQQQAVTHSQGVWSRQISYYSAIRDAETKKSSDLTAIKIDTDQAFNPGQKLSDISSVVDDALPPGAWLTGLNLQRGKPMEVRGTAKQPADVTEFVNNLGNNPRFRDVRLVFANSASIGQTPVVQFNVTAVCVGNLPMPVPAKQTGGYVQTTTTSSGGSQ